MSLSNWVIFHQFLLVNGVWVLFLLTICSVGDYVEENGGGNYSRQFKNMEMLVTRLESLQNLRYLGLGFILDGILVMFVDSFCHPDTKRNLCLQRGLITALLIMDSFCHFCC